jgi:hypothetical protein
MPLLPIGATKFTFGTPVHILKKVCLDFRITVMRRIISLFLLLAVAAALFACSSTLRGGGGSTPTEAYTNLFNAVKAKDTEAIKANMTKRTLEFAQMAAQKYKSPIEKVFENGMTATTYANSLPEIRDERISGNMGAIEVWNAKENKWEDLPFIFEDGAWRLAVGDQFADTYKLPAKGRDFREREAANAVGNTMIEIAPQSNANLVPVVPKRAPDAQ